MTPDEIDTIAERVAAKIAQGLLRMPDDLREAVAVNGAAGYFSAPGVLMPGPNAYYLQAHVRKGGIELEIRYPNGGTCWRAVIV